MPSTLFIRPKQLYSIEDALFEWALYDVAGEQVKYGPDMPLHIIDQTLMQNGIENVDLVALWPSSTCFSTSVSLPGGQTRYLQQALPFAVEEQVAQDIEQIHIALGKKLKNGDFSVINTDKSLFSAFFELLENDESDFKLKGIYADADLIPIDSENLVVLLSEKQVLIKGEKQELISTTESNLITYLDSIFLSENDSDSHPDGFKIKVVITPSKAESYQMLTAQLDQYPNCDVIVEQTTLSEFEILCENYLARKLDLVSLCQGEFLVNTQSSGTWQRWKSVASIAAIGFVLQLGVFIGQGLYFQKEAEKVGNQALAAYQKIVPNSKKVTLRKLPRIIKGKVNQSRSGTITESGFLTLLGEAGYQFSKSRNKQQLKFKSISFSEQRGELVLEMQAQSFDQLEALKNAIASAGYEAKISSAVQEKEYFRGRISVSDA